MLDSFSLFLLLVALIVVFAGRSTAIHAFVFGCIYSLPGIGFQFLGLSFPFFRILVLLAIARILIRGEHRSLLFVKTDAVIGFLSVTLLLASLFHEYRPGSGPVYVAGILIHSTGAYFVFRTFTSNVSVLSNLTRNLPLFLLPAVCVMVLEQIQGNNIFAQISGLSSEVSVRGGRIRSQGPFLHPILAGTIGATLLPFMFLLSKHKVRAGLLGISCVTMVVTSASSGPVVALLTILIYLSLWRFRQYLRYFHYVLLFAYILLLLVMNRAPYYLIADIDLAGGSTGWYRAYLIESTIRHFGEWWLFGTDNTAYWVPFQQGVSESHADITNQFVVYAVMGGLAALLLFIYLICGIYKALYVSFLNSSPVSLYSQRVLFLLGASFFGYLSTFLSVSLFGQAEVFFWMTIAFIVNIRIFADRSSVVTNSETRPFGFESA